MSNLAYLLTEIENTLRGSDRPEIALIHRYDIASDPQKRALVIAMAGKLIEQHKRLLAKT